MQSPKRFICSKCGKELANRHNLSRHKQSCKSCIHNVPERSPTYNLPTQPPPFPTFVAATAVKDDSSCENRTKNPKILALLDEIFNDGDLKNHVPPHEIHQEFSIIPPTTTSPLSKKNSVPPSTPTLLPKKMLFSPPKQQMLPKPSAEVIAAVLPSMSNILPTTTSSLRTKGDIVGYSDDEGSEQEYSSFESSSDEQPMSSKSDSSDDNMEVVEEFILPDTIEGIRDRFNELYVGFVRKGKHENRTELEFLLDELLRHGAIEPSEYTQLNTGLTVKEDLTIDKQEKEETEENK